MSNGLLESAITFRRSLPAKLAFIALNIVDLMLTIFAVNQGLTEVNPLMLVIFHSPLLLVLIKIVFPIIISWLIPGRLLFPAIILLSLVISWDIKELFIFLS